MLQPDKYVIEFGQELNQVLWDVVRPDFGDEAGGSVTPFTPIGNRGEGIELKRIAEDGEKQFVFPVQPNPRRGRCKHICELGRSRRKARPLVDSSREFQRSVVLNIETIGIRQRRDIVLELVAEAKRDEVGNPKL